MIPNQTKEELAQIANDIFKGYIFTDRHVHNQNDIGMVFMPLLFMGKKEDEDEGVETELNDWGMVYEYVSKAGPRSCNGMPMFMSFHIPNNQVEGDEGCLQPKAPAPTPGSAAPEPSSGD